jgi:hypothetical protein
MIFKYADFKPADLTPADLTFSFVDFNLANSLLVKTFKVIEVFRTSILHFGDLTVLEILIFTMVCISIVILCNFAILPFIFKSETKLQENVVYWTYISDSCREA